MGTELGDTMQGVLERTGAGRELDGHQLLAALRAFRRGDFSVRLPTDLSGLDGELAEAFNDAVDLNDRLSKEFERLRDVVGRQGKINQRAWSATKTAGSSGPQRRRFETRPDSYASADAAIVYAQKKTPGPRTTVQSPGGAAQGR